MQPPVSLADYSILEGGGVHVKPRNEGPSRKRGLSTGRLRPQLTVTLNVVAGAGVTAGDPVPVTVKV